jgi:hypothetical protein
MIFIAIVVHNSLELLAKHGVPVKVLSIEEVEALPLNRIAAILSWYSDPDENYKPVEIIPGKVVQRAWASLARGRRDRQGAQAHNSRLHPSQLRWQCAKVVHLFPELNGRDNDK